VNKHCNDRQAFIGKIAKIDKAPSEIDGVYGGANPPRPKFVTYIKEEKMEGKDWIILGLTLTTLGCIVAICLMV